MKNSVGGGIIDHKEEIIKELKANGFPYDPKIPPAEINVDELSYNSYHANTQRKHNVSEEEAKQFIKEADYSYTTVVKNKKGKTTEFENYYGKNGASYVNINENNIHTSFKRQEYTPFVENNIKIIDKYRK